MTQDISVSDYNLASRVTIFSCLLATVVLFMVFAWPIFITGGLVRLAVPFTMCFLFVMWHIAAICLVIAVFILAVLVACVGWIATGGFYLDEICCAIGDAIEFVGLFLFGDWDRRLLFMGKPLPERKKRCGE